MSTSPGRSRTSDWCFSEGATTPGRARRWARPRNPGGLGHQSSGLRTNVEPDRPPTLVRGPPARVTGRFGAGCRARRAHAAARPPYGGVVAPIPCRNVGRSRGFGRSLELKKRALLIAERNFGPTHPVLAEYFHSLGLAELDQGDYPAARLHFQQALSIYPARYGEWHELVATGYSVMADADARLGDYASARRSSIEPSQSTPA